jgi:outer membrane receptor protein involved in Fe transport
LYSNDPLGSVWVNASLAPLTRDDPVALPQGGTQRMPVIASLPFGTTERHFNLDNVGALGDFAPDGLIDNGWQIFNLRNPLNARDHGSGSGSATMSSPGGPSMHRHSRFFIRLAGTAWAAALLLGTVKAQETPEGVIEEVVVTGSYIRRQSQFDSPSPLITVTHEDLTALGVNEISDVIEDLTINTGSQNNPDAFTQNFSTGTSNVNLRGLGVSSSLVLLNGRRQTQSAAATDRGENFVDTSSLPPMIAFDRVEILKDGATALYGSEAVAGVMNFLTRSNFEGFDLQLEWQTVDGHPQEDRQISALWGGGDGDTHVLAAISVLDRQPLSTNDRRLSGPTDDLSQAGNPGSFLVPTLPGNPAYALVWTAAFDSNLNGVADALEPRLGLPPVPGAQLPVFADPDCTNIAVQDPQVVPSIAVSVPSAIGAIPLGLCQFDFGAFYSLVPDEQRISAYLELNHDFSNGVSGRVEVHGASNEAKRNNSPSFPFAAFPTVPATHPDNPYGTNVNFIGRVIGGGGVSSPSIHESETSRIAAAVSGDVDAVWQWEFGITGSANDFAVAATDVLFDRFNLAIGGLGGGGCDATAGMPGVGSCLYFNPFGTSLTSTGTGNSAALIEDLLGDFTYDSDSELWTLDGFVTRDIGELAGGAAGFAVGVQLRDEEIAYDYDSNANAGNFLFFSSIPDFAGRRDVHAVFFELALPVSEAIDLQIAGRFEDYGRGVDSTDPKVSLLWRPSVDFSIRASVGTSFRAPSLFQEFGTQTTLNELIDPSVGIPQFFPVRAQANSSRRLNPEEADVANIGFSWSITDDLEFGIDYWSFDYKQVIIQQNPQAILNAAALGDPRALAQVVRDPASGLLLRVDSYFANASALDTDGFDFSIAYTHDFRGSATLRLGADATRISSYDLVDPQAGGIDGLGRRNFANFATSTPELRANAFANWAWRNHAIDVFVRHIDGYVDDEVEIGQGPGFFTAIGSFTTLDTQYTIRLRSDSGPTLSFGTINLLDENPPRVATNGGYDSKIHDPRGRLLYAKAGFQF